MQGPEKLQINPNLYRKCLKIKYLNRLASSMKGLFSNSVNTFHSDPNRLDISELCILGFSWAILRRCPLDQTMKAFMGLLICSPALLEAWPPFGPISLKNRQSTEITFSLRLTTTRDAALDGGFSGNLTLAVLLLLPIEFFRATQGKDFCSLTEQSCVMLQ